jgi:hypothetical protein
MKTEMNFSPDGMNSGYAAAAAAVSLPVAFNDADYDDGLVHSHCWATSSRAPLKSRPTAMKAPRHDRPAYDDFGYDDGLVHSHSWASSTPER